MNPDTVSEPSDPVPDPDTKYIFSFGDSYSETGFIISGPKPFAHRNPIGNPPFPGSTTCNGTNWIGHLITTFAKSPTVAYTFAYSGGVVDRSIVTPYMPEVQTLGDQTATFRSNLACKPDYAPWKAENTLFALWFGINDIGTSWGADCDDAWIGKVLDSYFEQVQILHDSGGRNFVLLTVPPIHKTPVMLDQTPMVQTVEASVVSAYNKVLASCATVFRTANPEANVWVFDTQVPFDAAIADPEAYGAPSATCLNADGRSCLWKDDYHPGQALHELVAKGVVDLVGDAFF